MHNPTATQASNLPQDQPLKDFPEDKDIKKSPNLFLTPQRRDETLRKEIY